MRLYVHPLSQHARRVLILCLELGLEVEQVPIAVQEGEHQRDEYLNLSTTGLVPLLDDEGFRLPESHAIMRYLCDREDADRFYPRNARKRAEVDLWLDWTHATLNPPIQTTVLEAVFKGDQGDKALVSASRERAASAIAPLERGSRNYPVLTDRPNIADIAIATTLALHEMAGGEVSHAPAVETWFAAFKQRSSYIETAAQAA